MRVIVYQASDTSALSKNFTRKDFKCPCGCTRQMVDSELVEKLQAIRDKLGKAIKVTSGYRCITHNASSSLRLFNGGELNKAMASCFDAEGVVSQEAMIKEVFHHHIKSFISFQCPPLRRNVSSVSRPLAMPRITKIF